MYNEEHTPPYIDNTEDRPIIIGLVGRYGCGKSTYAQYHQEQKIYKRSHFKAPIVEALRPFGIITEGPNKDRIAMRSLTYWADENLGREIFSDVANKEWLNEDKPYVMYDDVRRLPEALYILENDGLLLGFGPPITKDEESAYEIPNFNKYVRWTHHENGEKI